MQLLKADKEKVDDLTRHIGCCPFGCTVLSTLQQRLGFYQHPQNSPLVMFFFKLDQSRPKEGRA